MLHLSAAGTRHKTKVEIIEHGKPPTFVRQELDKRGYLLQDDEVVSPRLLSEAEPSYTDGAKAAKLQGTVALQVEVWEDGRPHNIRVRRSLGLGLDEKAIEAVRLWRFAPRTKDGSLSG